jgi:hypothetical protein
MLEAEADWQALGEILPKYVPRELQLPQSEAGSKAGCILCAMVYKAVMHFRGDTEMDDIENIKFVKWGTDLLKI